MDGSLLLWINQGWAHPWLDVYFELVSAKAGFSFPLMALIIVALGLRYGVAGWRVGLGLLVLVVFGDAFGNLLKDGFGMPRPCLDWAAQLRGLGDSLFIGCEVSNSGMPSNHALNFFSTFVFMSLVLRRWYWTTLFLLLAVSVGLSRIYLGSHFPSQVLVGALIGAAWGGVFSWICVRHFDFMRQVWQQRSAA
ncbi:MAG: phosphatase PAP2 family protein [Gammaproteobacteria bacterium]|nr:phosphatase PAP2 family protein [Gammaproteobacteria bacterium]